MTTTHEEPPAAPEGGKAPLPNSELRDRIHSRNAGTLGSLERELRSPLGVIPFVGAGKFASVRLAGDPPQFPQWGELLSVLAVRLRIEAEGRELVENGDHEGATSEIDAERPGGPAIAQPAVLSRRSNAS